MGGRDTATDDAVSGGWTEQTVNRKLQYRLVKREKLQNEVIGKVITTPPRPDGVTLPMPAVDRRGCFQGLAGIPKKVRSKSRSRFTVAGGPVAATETPLPAAAAQEPPPAVPWEVDDEEREKDAAEEVGGVWQWVMSTMQELAAIGTEEEDAEEDYATIRYLSGNVDSFTSPEWESDPEDATPSQDPFLLKEAQPPGEGAASESDEMRSQSESTQATASCPGETDTITHNCGFLRLTHGPGSMKIQVLRGEMLDDDLVKALKIFSAFLEHSHSQDGFAMQYDLRQVSMPPMSFLSRIAEWGNEPARAERFQTMQTSCSVVLSAGWTFSIARGVLGSFFCLCPPACRTYLISDPDQDVNTAEVYFDPAPSPEKATVTPSEGALSELAHGPSVALVASHALEERKAETVSPDEAMYQKLEKELWDRFTSDLMFQHYNHLHWYPRLVDSQVEKS